MSGSRTLEFVDTNILIYAFDSSAGMRQDIAQALLRRLWDERCGCLSVQILQEFFVTVTRKIPRPLATDEASERIRDFSAWTVFAARAEDVLAAIALQREAKLQFWDGLVIQAAAQLGCDVLWTEDMNHGQVVRGVRIQNPFEADGIID